MSPTASGDELLDATLEYGRGQFPEDGLASLRYAVGLGHLCALIAHRDPALAASILGEMASA